VEPVALRFAADVAWIEFGDPAARNLLTVPLLEALPRALAEAEVRGARVAVLRGRGDLWSGGYDIGQIPSELFTTAPGAALDHPFERCMRAVEACPLPTLAAVNGHAVGGSVELALACDLRLLVDTAKIGITAAKLGLVYPHGGIERLWHTVGPAHAREILFTGELFGAADALRLGLVNRIVPAAGFDAAVQTLAARMAAAAPLAVQGMKHVLQLLERGSLSESDVAGILDLRARSYASQDFREGRAAFLEKRPPNFRGS